ncbi:MAG: hypothetical protein AAF364_04995 [Pseudomonadota bacterium]
MYTDFVELRLKQSMSSKVQWAKPHDVLTVVWCDYRLRRIAVANMSEAFGWDAKKQTMAEGGDRKKAHQMKKPKVFQFSEAEKLFDLFEQDGGIGTFIYPKIIREPESVLEESQLSKWYPKADNAISVLGSLIEPDAIERYLLNNGHSELLKQRLQELRDEHPNKKFSSQTVLTRYLNQYITFGMTRNALLPLGLMNTGCNYQHSENNNVNKRGRGGADGRNTSSIYTGVRPLDKRLIKKIAKRFGTASRHGALFIRDIYDDYCAEALNLQGVELPEPDENGERDVTRVNPFILSEGSFRYHYDNMIPLLEKLTLRYGVIRTQRDFKDRQGHAADSVVGANHVVEIDSTELSVHVRDPRFKDKRLSAGRVFLTVAICVRTRYILGYSLSFKQPTWENVAECLYNALEDKKAYCERYGLSIKEHEWPCHHGFFIVRIDNGKEFPADQMDEQLRHRSGVFRVEIVPKARGDLKAVVERQFGTTDRNAAKQPGGIEADRDKTEQDASQRAMMTIDELHRVIIRMIIHQNLYKNCAKLRDKDMAEAGVGITPYSLWSYSIKHQMGGGRPVSKSKLPSYRYSLLPKCEVEVKDDGVHYNGLVFDSAFAKKNDWYLNAKYSSKNTVKTMALTPSLANSLFYEDLKGNIHEFKLVEQLDQYRDLSWDEYAELKKEVNQLVYDNAHQRHLDRLAMKAANRGDVEKAEKELSSVPRNDQTSYQSGANDRRAELAELESKKLASRHQQQLLAEVDTEEFEQGDTL